MGQGRAQGKRDPEREERGRTVGAKERVQGEAQDVDAARDRLALPVPLLEALADVEPVVELDRPALVPLDVRHGLAAAEELGEEDAVVERDRHAAARERVPHVERVAGEERALRVAPLRVRREVRVGHRPQAVLLVLCEALVERGVERRDDGRREDGRHVLAQPRGELGLRRELGPAHVDEHARVVRRELVHEDGAERGHALGDGCGRVGRVGLAEDDVPVVRRGKVGVLEDEADKVRARRRDDVRREERAAELAHAPVGDDGELGAVVERLGRVVVGARLAGRRLDADDGAGLVLEELVDGRLDEGDALRALGLATQVLDEEAVVEAAALLLAVGAVAPAHRLGLLRVRDGDDLVAPEDLVALARDGVDALDRVVDAELLQCEDAAGLEELADDAVGLGQVALEEEDGPARLGERVGEDRTEDARADDADVVRRCGGGLWVEEKEGSAAIARDEGSERGSSTHLGVCRGYPVVVGERACHLGLVETSEMRMKVESNDEAGGRSERSGEGAARLAMCVWCAGSSCDLSWVDLCCSGRERWVEERHLHRRSSLAFSTSTSGLSRACVQCMKHL